MQHRLLPGEHLSRTHAPLAVVAVLLAACSGSSTAPGGGVAGLGASDTLRTGQSLTVTLVASDSARDLHMAGVRDSVYALTLHPVAGGIQVLVRDQADGSPVTRGSVVTGSGTDVTRTYDVEAHHTGPYLVSIASLQPGAAASVDVSLASVDVQPEHAAPVLRADSVVTSESLDGLGDIDRFSYSGTAGSVIRTTLSAVPGTPGNQALCLDLDDSTGTPVDFAIARASDTALQGSAGSGYALPASGTYWVEIGSGRNQCGGTLGGVDLPYVGPYRVAVFRVDSLPETRAAGLAPGDTVREAIDYPSDVDAFTVHGSPGAAIDVFLRALGTGLYRSVTLTALINGTPQISIASGPADTALDERHTGDLVFPASGQIVLSVAGVQEGGTLDTGPYELYVYPVNPAPEHVAAAITPGDTVVGEAIDEFGDVDEFHFTGQQGAAYDAILQARGAPASARLTLGVYDAGDSAIAPTTLSYGTDTAFMQTRSIGQTTGLFRLPASGTYTVRVAGWNDRDSTDRGSYRFILYPIDTLPETASPTLTFGDSVMNESLDVPGDVDVFTVALAESTGVVFDLRSPAFLAASLNPATGTDTIADILAGTASGRLHLSPGTYHLRVRGWDNDAIRTLAHGPFALRTYAFGFGPEIAKDTMTFGDTVTTETLMNRWDVDTFAFKVRSWQHGDLVLSDSGTATIIATLAPSGGPPFLDVLALGGSETFGVRRSARIDFPSSGWYTIRVQDYGYDSNFVAPTPFTVAMVKTDLSPEHASANLALGDSVVSEAIDYPGDVDDFDVSGTPGQLMTVSFAAATTPGKVQLQVIDTATDAQLGMVYGTTDTLWSGRLVVPATGHALITVLEPRYVGYSDCNQPGCGNVFSETGAYVFHVFSISLAPEIAGATLALGDTVSETIYPVGDIDEFTYSGTQGQTVGVYLEGEATSSFGGYGLSAQLIDPSNGAVLTSTAVFGVVATDSPAATLPRTGAYTVRVQTGQDNQGFGPYRIAVHPSP